MAWCAANLQRKATRLLRSQWLRSGCLSRRAQGASLVDVAEIPNTANYAETELTVLLTELKVNLPLYLAAYAPDAPVKRWPT